MDVIYGYDVLNGYPLYTMAGQSLDGVLSVWRERRRASIAGATAFSALVLVMTALLNHYMTALRRREVHYLTARKRAEQDLRSLSAELMRSQDEERRRIGRDLHDSTGQTLAALELGLAQLIRDSAALTPQRRALLEHCTRLAAQCSGEIRTASYLLHPPLLDELGLLSALRWLADGFHERSTIEVRLDLPQSMERLPPDHELTLFRIAQEGLTNVHRHSASPWVAVRVRLTSTTITLEVEDAGRGMLPPSCGSDGEVTPLGVGLAGMRERVRQIGGSFCVESTGAGAGTRIRATISIAQQHDALARRPASEESA
jgi:signal transduction histidine kinase